MKRPTHGIMLVWAARDLLRRPGEATLLGLSLLLLTTWIAAALLFTQALETTSARVLQNGPSIVVRRLDAGGWAPFPIEEGLSSARAVPGVLAARPRFWGTVSGPEGAVTAVGWPAGDSETAGAAGIGAPPAPGEAIVGPGVGRLKPGDIITLRGATTLRVSVRSVLPAASSLCAHDVVFLDAGEAARLLGLPRDHASDLAVEVFHASEEEAILPDLSRAFPWPVRITTRSQTSELTAAAITRGGGTTLLLAVPALLALAFLAAGTARDRSGRRAEVGLLKSMGWTTGDVMRLHLSQALALGIPSTSLGLAIAYGLVFWVGTSWPGRLLFGWSGAPPSLSLDPEGAAKVLLEVSALVLLPWVAASAGSALRGATADPQDLIEAGEALT